MRQHLHSSQQSAVSSRTQPCWPSGQGPDTDLLLSSPCSDINHLRRMLTRSLSHGKKSLPIPIVLVTLIGWNLSGDIYFISSLRGHSKYPASQLEEIPVDRFSLWRMKRKKIKVREVLYPANLMGLIV